MAEIDGIQADGRLARNILQFGRVLRRAGLPVGPGRVLQAIEAEEAVGIGDRTDFYWTLHAVFVNRRDQREVFDQAFHVFWRNPNLLERMLTVMLPPSPGEASPDDTEISRRVSEAMMPEKGQGQPQPPQNQDVEFDAAFTWSDREILRTMDFEQMSAEEIRRAKAVLARMRLPLMDVPTRRFRRDPTGPRIDLRATIRESLRGGGGLVDLARRRRRVRHPPLVVLCDISGSMSRYSRMLLHFLHAVTNDRDRVHVFVFGTRLTNVTRALRSKDVDVALGRIGAQVQDWSGGTRIGHCIDGFNRDWSRRVLGQGAVVLLISDGLDRDGGVGLSVAMDRLHRSCRRLIWLNPLLRWDGFAPKSSGIRAMLPHVDEFRSAHSLESLEELARLLAAERPAGPDGVRRWLKEMAA
ncbi:MAG: vWA domain-containing protein [Rhodospirillales bacterium]